MNNKTADIQEMLVRYLKDTHAMEKNVSHMLDGMINTTEDPAIPRRPRAPQRGDEASHGIDPRAHRSARGVDLAAHRDARGLGRAG